MENITEGIMEIKSLEKTIFVWVCQLGCKIMEGYLRQWDQILMSQRDTNQYRYVDCRSRGIKTIMGTIPYERNYYKKTDGSGYVALLDEAIGLEKGTGLVSEYLAEQIANECTDKSYRKAAESVSTLTGQPISRMGAWNIVQGFGGRVQKQVERLKELDDSGTVGQLGNVSSPVLFAEFDDIWLNMQREERKKAVEPEKKGRRRIGKKPMHIGTAYTGWEEKRDGSYETMNKFAFAGFSEAAVFATRFEALLRQRYDMDGIERLIINGDGEGWIKTVAENNDAILQLDPFHKSQAIMRAVKDKDERKKIHDALNKKDVEKTLDHISALIAKTSDEPTLKKLEALLTYFDNNKDYLLPWQERGIAMPAPPEGVTYRNMGLQEHNNCDLITQRMKHRKGSWSPNGATNMAAVLCLRNTIGINAMLGILPEMPEAVAPPEPLSAAKTPQQDGKGYGAAWLYAKMPFVETFVTAGRDAIRGLLGQRKISDLKFI